MTVDYQKLSLDTTSFSDFILQSKIYVDKTDLIASLARRDYPIFLARPRRFGKSTLVSTFEELFSHGLEKFKGLKIATQNLWQDKTYKVLHLDLSYIKENTDEFSFSSKFQEIIVSGLNDLGIETTDSSYAITSFKNAIKKLPNRSLVLLIDEYDAPLTTAMGDPIEFNRRRNILSEFFLSIKSYSAKFRFIFITGVTRYSHVSIFSAFNNIIDLSFNPQYGAILGYTQEELEFYFKDYLENAAHALNEENNTNTYTYELVLQKVKDHYDGYSFDKKCRTHVYNPWSILNFLSAPQDGFGNYWLETGGSQPSILVNYFKSVIDRKIDKSVLLNYLSDNIEIPVELDSLCPTIESIEKSTFPFEAILYQAGYFTLKRVDDLDYYIGIPNVEVENAFIKIVIENLINKSTQQFRLQHKQEARDALNHKDLKGFKDLLNVILNEFSYESLPSFKEVHFRDVFKVMLCCMGFVAYTEYQTAQGRSDLNVITDKYLYVIEFKVISDNDPALIAKALNIAKEQIKDRKYNLRLDSFNKREVVPLACVIVNQSKDATHDKPYRELVELVEVSS